ncbi:hypothetical protein BDN71DRAFT_1448034 [Pleurotus eryngii]|uniref:Uncharacterized protein n=1 Tax=Pleurotus eryngii TaxID=5323 RepID=A0A9P6DGJ2_PLEER|nr:hypothetical protein BDN71DRAFT_1448034 [Pleurotus eryngii]
MSEPAYAKFLFIRECDICLDQPDVLHAFAHRSVNYCRDCVKDKVIWDPRTRLDLCKALPLDDGYGVDSIVRCVLLFKDPQHIFSYAWLRQDYEEVLNEYRRSPGRDSKEKRKKFCQARQEIIRSQDKFCEQYFQCDIARYMIDTTTKAIREAISKSFAAYGF